MPEIPPEPGAPDPGADQPAGDARPEAEAEDAQTRQALDVPEWVSELRRLYVEPKTRAELRQARGLGWQKHRISLPKVRGSSPPTPPPTPAPEPAPEGPSPLEAIASGAVHPDVTRPVPEPIADRPQAAPTSAADTGSEPDEDAAASWLSSYLAATGHSAEPRGADPAPDTSGPPEPDLPVVPDRSGPEAGPVASTEAPRAPLEADPHPPGAAGADRPQDVAPDAEVVATVPSDDAHEAEDTPGGGSSSDRDVDRMAPVQEHEQDAREQHQEHHRTLAELAGLTDAADADLEARAQPSQGGGVPVAADRVVVAPAEGDLPAQPTASGDESVLPPSPGSTVTDDAERGHVATGAAPAVEPEPNGTVDVEPGPDEVVLADGVAVEPEPWPAVPGEPQPVDTVVVEPEPEPGASVPVEPGPGEAVVEPEPIDTVVVEPEPFETVDEPEPKPESGASVPVEPGPGETAVEPEPVDAVVVEPEPGETVVEPEPEPEPGPGTLVPDEPEPVETVDEPEPELESESESGALVPVEPGPGETAVEPEPVDAVVVEPEPGETAVEPEPEPEPGVAVPVGPEPGDASAVEPGSDQVLQGDAVPREPELADTVVVEAELAAAAPDQAPAVEPEPVEARPSDAVAVDPPPAPQAPAGTGDAGVAVVTSRSDLHHKSTIVPPEPSPSDDVAPAHTGDPATAPARSDDTAPKEPERHPGRPSTVPRVTLSWREAESFDIGLPSVDADQEAIVVEPPSQLVARPRRRRPEPRVTDEDNGDEAAAPNPAEHGRDVQAQEPEPAGDRPDDGAASSRSRRVRWIVVGGLLLVVLAFLAWYFLLRDSGDGSAAPALRGSTATVSTSVSITPGFFRS